MSSNCDLHCQLTPTTTPSSHRMHRSPMMSRSGRSGIQPHEEPAPSPRHSRTRSSTPCSPMSMDNGLGFAETSHTLCLIPTCNHRHSHTWTQRRCPAIGTALTMPTDTKTQTATGMQTPDSDLPYPLTSRTVTTHCCHRRHTLQTAAKVWEVRLWMGAQ